MRKPIPDGFHGSSLPLHDYHLFNLGVDLGELCVLADMAGLLNAHVRTPFLLTAPLLWLTEAVGSPVAPV